MKIATLYHVYAFLPNQTKHDQENRLYIPFAFSKPYAWNQPWYIFLWHNGCWLMAPKCHACLLRHVWNRCSLRALGLAMNGKFRRKLINNPMKRSNSVAIFIKWPVQFCGTRSTRAPNIHRRAAVLQAGRSLYKYCLVPFSGFWHA